MALILYIETATGVCSAALAENDRLISEKHTAESRLHAQLLTVFIDQLMQEAGYTYHQLDAVCVSKGPGSYTGLRIGVAVAKGLCFGLDKPLLAVNTLFSMTVCMIEQLAKRNDLIQNELLYVPMIDARRMEVYVAVYDAALNEISPTQALILNKESFTEYNNRKLIFFGDGAGKLKELIDPHINAEFITDFEFSAKGMVNEGNGRFISREFENTAYFEPFYLKEFLGHKRV